MASCYRSWSTEETPHSSRHNPHTHTSTHKHTHTRTDTHTDTHTHTHTQGPPSHTLTLAHTHTHTYTHTPTHTHTCVYTFTGTAQPSSQESHPPLRTILAPALAAKVCAHLLLVFSVVTRHSDRPTDMEPTDSSIHTTCLSLLYCAGLDVISLERAVVFCPLSLRDHTTITSTGWSIRQRWATCAIGPPLQIYDVCRSTARS
jgi:hypothetical protein